MRRVDAEKVLRSSWDEFTGVPDFEGLAPAAVHGRPPLMAPFNVTPHVLDASYQPPGAQWVVMLVPATRPADVVSVIGAQMTEYLSDAEISGLLRSWEERFAAVVVGVGPGAVDLAVGSPPRSDAQARRLAAEQVAFAPESGWEPNNDGLRTLARALRVNDGQAERSRYIWQFGWPD